MGGSLNVGVAGGHISGVLIRVVAQKTKDYIYKSESRRGTFSTPPEKRPCP